MEEKTDYYSRFEIKTPADINTLEALAKIRKDLTQDDYTMFLKMVKQEANYNILIHLLETKIKKLVYSQQPAKQTLKSAKKKSAKKKVPEPSEKTNPEPQLEPCFDWYKPYEDIFSWTYTASEFNVQDGCICLGPFQLKSVRIKEIDPMWLAKIEHKFSIAPEANRPWEFHFVPYSDLSYLLDTVQDLIERHEQACEREKKRIFMEKIPMYLEKFFPKDFYQINSWLDEEYGRKYYRKYYEIFRKLDILPYDCSEQEFYKQLHCSGCYIPISDLRIEDYLVSFDTTNVDIESGRSLSSFLYHVEKDSGMNENEMEEWEPVLTSEYQIREKEYRSHFTPTVHIKTHLTAAGFREAFVDKKQNQSGWNNPPRFFAFPSAYLRQPYNDDLSILVQLDKNLLFDVLTSEPFEFSKEVVDRFEELKKTIPTVEGNNGHWYDITVGKLRTGTGIPGIMSSIYFRKRGCRFIRFLESYSHYSDWRYNKSVERSDSYLVFNSCGNSLRLIPSDTKYTSRYFSVNTKEVPIEVTAYALIKYFSSDIDNKRQDFVVTPELEHFGLLR